MSYQIILFDLDDTLIDFGASETISLQRVYQQYYQDFDYSLFETLYKEINTALWKRVGAKENSLMPKEVRFLRFKYLNEQLGSAVETQDVANQYDHHLGECAEWLPEVKNAIQFLHQKGHVLGIITNGLSDAQGKKRQRLELFNWFDCFVVSDEVGIAKPNKEIFDFALEEIANKYKQPIHAYDKNAMLMVGDSLISDGYGAMNFGINYCHINRRAEEVSSAETSIKYHISSVAHLPACIGYEAEYSLYLSDLA